MDKLKMHTPNIADENFAALAKLFPNAVTETIDPATGEVVRAIDKDVLMQEINTRVVDGREERYQFTWPDKKKAVLAANSPINATLRPCREESVDFDTTENLYIEGDNLDVLKLLQETYLGKVKMIYIDPPYNTGNDFVYNDDFAESAEDYLDRSGQYDEEGNRLVQNTESNGRFHTDWLNMIYPRLKLAKTLLSEDGVIFISIDDNEQENLKKVCDEVFGYSNFVFQISWRRTDNQPNIGAVARVKEYIICYAKQIDSMTFGKLPLTDKAKNEYRYQDERGMFRRAILLDKTRGRHRYPITTKSGNILNGPWMKTEEEFKRLDNEGLIYWTSGGDEQPYGKIYLDETKGQIPNDFWGIEYGTNQRASLEVEKLFDKRYFDFPKPVSLLSNLLRLGSTKDSIILDFFSGSATTAHAVMQLNVEEISSNTHTHTHTPLENTSSPAVGRRKFIMVQLPEPCDEKSEAYKAGYKNICEIGKERIRRAAKKIAVEHPEAQFDGGFRVLKLDSSNMQDVYYTPAEFTQATLDGVADNIKPDRTPMDLLFQVMLDLGVLLSSDIKETTISGKTVFNVEDNYLIACFDENITDEVITAIAKQKPYYFVMRDSSMADDSVATNFEQIFATYSPDTDRKVL